MYKNIYNWSLLLIAFFLLSCEQRDPEVEFQRLAETSFTNVRDAIDATNDYIDYFYKKSSRHLQEVYQMRTEYRVMDALFNESYHDYVEFIDRVNEAKNKGEDSSSAGVRETWRQLFSKKKHSLLDPGLEKLDKSSFEAYMSENARELCKDGTIFMKADECDVVELGEPQLTDDGFSKTCEGTFRVHLKGKLVGLLKSTALIKLKGKIVGDGIPTFQYKMVEYEIIEAPTELKDVISTAAQLLI
ncbi:MAG: hypothetical protein J5637_08065 [Prevotella sp.]|nr:hypothetical protein [Prevotella sp.]